MFNVAEKQHDFLVSVGTFLTVRVVGSVLLMSVLSSGSRETARLPRQCRDVPDAGKECPVIAIPARSPTPAPDNTTDELVGVSSSTPAPVLSCPGIDDPANFTECCYEYDDDQEDQEDGEGSADGGSGAFLDAVKKVTDDDDDGPKVRKPRCCAPKIEQSFLDWLLGLDDRICRVAMIVALSVTGTLLLFTIIFIVCCFWSKCPLYYTCRVKYDKDDIIATAGDEETANLTDMPAEEKGVKGYSPNEVKVTTLNEEEEPCLKKEKEADEQQPLVEKKEEKKKDEKKKEDKKKEEKKKEDKKKEEKKKE
ncbi:uncharacterized protein LOC108665264, partial [Hyalella azteca]|uniref:Uncharacterized protein LOC108665264 n=1 Tax=Hyalella azteca TaxID=294128 RepID=A0A8B7N2P7_HYAAZ